MHPFRLQPALQSASGSREPEKVGPELNLRLAVCVILLLFLSRGPLPCGTTGKIAGRVKDSATGQPLVGANIVVVGTTLGAVTDATGAVVPGAQVVVTNKATNLATSVVSNNDGYFVVPNLIVGGYSIEVTKEGFKKALRSSVTLEVDQRAQINIVLETGAVTETVEVSSQAPLVDTTTATFGKVIENRLVQELPLNGRNALSLVLLAPAVQSGVGPTASGFADRGTQVSFIRINGSPFATNNFVVDGLSSFNAYLPDVNIGSGSLIDNFTNGRYLGVPMLQWIGLTADKKRAKEMEIEPYPCMIKWVLD